MKKLLAILLTLLFANAILAQSVAPSKILEGSYQNNLTSDNEKRSKGQDQDVETYRQVGANENNKLRTVDPSWRLPEVDSSYLNLNNIRFTNRARCAEDSRYPAKQANLIIDSMNVAKVAYRLGQVTGQNPKSLTKMAVRKFRYANYQLLSIIANKLMAGKLPLLPAKNTSDYYRKRYRENRPPNNSNESNSFNRPSYRDHILDEYRKISNNCRQDEYCEELDLYLEKIWKNSNTKYTRKTKKTWSKVDSFTKKHFVTKSVLDDKDREFNLSCHYLKKFSPFMAQVSTVTPNKKVLEALALSQKDQSEFITTCDDFEAQSSLESVAYQLDLTNLDSSDWNKVGFDFWNSLKLYYSWAWRNAPQTAELFFPFEEIFKSVYLEESAMIFPTGCKSVTIPECDSNFLSAQKIRNFSKKTYERNALNLDFMKHVPDGPEQELLDDPFVDYNNDILEYGKFPDMGKWASKFSKNLRRSRRVMKGRLLKAINFLRLAEQHLTVDKIDSNLSKIVKDRKEWSTNSDSAISNEEFKNQLYYLCSEFNVGAHEVFSFIKSDMNYLKSFKSLDPIFGDLTGKKLADYYSYFQDTAKAVLKTCSKLEETTVWKDFEADKSGYNEWYNELMFKREVEMRKAPTTQNIIGNPMFVYKANNITPNNVICYNGVDCSRKALASIIDIYSVSKYLKTFFADDQSISSPALNNPYAERTACRIYDPWWKVKRTLFNFFSDITASAVSLVNPTPFYLAIDYVPQRAVSFNKLVEDGKVKFDPQMNGNKWLGGFGADLNKLIGIPCTVAAGNYGGELPSRKPYFAGFTFKGCATNTNGGQITVSAADDIDKDTLKTLQGCLSCTINFETVTHWAANFANLPVISTAYYLVRGVTRFYQGFSDPIEIPRRWEVNPNNVLETYRRYGTIPKKCVKPLSKGDYCMPSKCEWSVARAVQELYGTQLTYMDESFDGAEIKVRHCKRPIKVVDTKIMGLFCRENYTKDHFWKNDSCDFPKERKK